MFVCASQRGSLPYQKLTVPEHSPPGTVVGNVTRAVDADEGSNAIVYYFIAGDAVIFTFSRVLSKMCLWIQEDLEHVHAVCLEALVSIVWSD